jgi:single-strand DNA-binding protein
MAGSVNKVILIGNVGKDPEIKSFDNGGKVANFSIATSESWKDKQSGERKEKTDWHNVAVFGQLADIVERYVKKGSKLYVEGKLSTRTYEKDGEKRYVTEVVLQGFGAQLNMLDGKSSGDSGSGQQARGSSSQQSSQRADDSKSNGGGFADDDLEDLPF